MIMIFWADRPPLGQLFIMYPHLLTMDDKMLSKRINVTITKMEKLSDNYTASTSLVPMVSSHKIQTSLTLLFFPLH